MQQAAKKQYHVVLACFLGWTIDAFDFFIVVFVVSDIAREFNASVTTITWAFTLTLALRGQCRRRFRGRAIKIQHPPLAVFKQQLVKCRLQRHSAAAGREQRKAETRFEQRDCCNPDGLGRLMIQRIHH